MRAVSAIGLLLIVAAFPARVAAQTAAPAGPPPPPPKLEGTAEAAFVGTSGNASTNSLSIGGEVIGRPTHWVLTTRANVIRNEAEEVVTAEAFLFGFRAEREINARLSAFGEYIHFQDEFAGIDQRNSMNGGLMIKLVGTAAHTLSADAGLGYLNEQRLTGDDVSSATYGGGSRYEWKISPTATLDDEARLLGTFDLAEDWRFTHRIALTARLTDLLSLKVSNTIRYLHFPPPGFKTTDSTTAVALVAKFARP